MCYVYSSLDRFSSGWVGDDIEDIRLHLHTGSDFVGCTQSNKSISGVLLVLEGTKTYQEDWPCGIFNA